MTGEIYIDETRIGEADFNVIDESMGVIEGKLVPNENYDQYRTFIRECGKRKGIANRDDLNLRILYPGSIELQPDGGIGVTDVEGFEEVIVEAAGLDLSFLYE